MSERWVPRCRICHNGHIIVAPSPSDPQDFTHSVLIDNRWFVYCIECGHTSPITELLYVRL